MHTFISKPPLSSSFNQLSCLFHDTCELNPVFVSSPLSPKCSCSCFSCCYAANVSACDRLAPLNPRFLSKGLSQSTLIQWSLSKNLIFHGRMIRQSYGYTSGFSSFNNLDESFFYEKVCTFKNKKKKQFLSNVSDGCFNDVEVMLSLLTNEVDLEYNDVKNIKNIIKGKKSRNLDNKGENLEKESENLALKKEGSFGELEGNNGIEIKSDCYVGQTSSSEDKNSLKKDCKGCIDEDVGTVEKRQESVQEQEGLLDNDTVNEYYGEAVGVSYGWRKKTEKKLIKESSQHKSNVSVDTAPCKQHSVEILKIADEPGSRMKYKRFTEMSDNDKTVIESTSITENKDDVSSGQKNGGSRHSSHGSGPKGPSDEMWHMSDASTQEPSEPDNFDEWEETYSLKNKQRNEDEMFMREALLEAKKAADVWEVPVGAVLVKDGKIIARGHNMVEELQDSTAHAEMICIRKASTIASSWRLSDTTLYITLEPCPMCAGAILQARIQTVVWGAPNKLLGADGSWIRLFCDGDGGSSSMSTDIPPAPAHPFHRNMVVRRGVLAAECGEVMRHFFQLRRKKITKPEQPNLPSSINVSHHHSNFLSKIHHAFKVIFCL